ncbi:hypothetical protein GCM10009836_21760 [Pseudonocardia ailaonensis]|uniref:DUF885 domain-containing protein n=1 Tax=Pseudonocardia ailaonensis TaxID=367279 RepID=A0ABN2MYY3_9PSEU
MDRSFPAEMVRLALRLDRLEPGLVEAWHGDPALRRGVASEPLARASDLATQADELRRRLPGEDLARERAAFLDGELSALGSAARRLAGLRVPLPVEIRETYGVDVALGDPDRYREAHRSLDALLPGRGDVGARLAAHRSADELPATRRRAAVSALVTALRERSRSLVDLPADEELTLEFVEGRPWSGLTRHLGGHRSVARFSVDGPQRAGQLARLVAHETYPGHHVEHLRRVAAARTAPERALSLTRSPRALVVEGAADLGLDAAVGPGWGPWAANLLARVGVRTDGALAERLDEAMLPLQHARLDAALLVATEGPDVALEHLRRWLLLDEARARRVLTFVADPHWRAYSATYVVGYPMVRAWWAGRPECFRALLDRPLVPGSLGSSDVRNWADRVPSGRDVSTTDGVDHAMSGRPFC